MQPQDYKYWAFISYSHQDRAWGNWLHRSLETYRLPRRLVGREHWSGPLPRRLAPVFRDRDELPSSADLSSVINQALLDSRYLIVICSPQSATSRWVNEEIKHFKALGRADRVLPLIIGGEPNASDRPASGLAECLPPAVRFEVTPAGELTDRRTEPIAADARGGKDGRADARLKLLAGMIGVGFDELKQRERRRLIWQRVMGTAAIVALTLAAATFWRWQQVEKQHALEALALKNRIATLYENGRQELLAHNEARAAAYLNEVYKLGVDTSALRFMLGRAMRVVDAQTLRIQTGSPVLVADLSPDGSRMLSIGADLHLRIWNAQSGAKVAEHDLGSDANVVFAAFSAGGKIVWADTLHPNEPKRRLRIFFADDGRLTRAFKGDPDYLGNSPPPIDSTETRIAFLQPDKSIAVATLLSPALQRIAGRYTAVQFCKGRSSLLAGTANGDVLLLDVNGGRVLHRFAGLRSTIAAVDSSTNCQVIASGTVDGTVRVWNATTGEELMAGGHSHAITDLRLSADGTRLMSLTHQGVNVWNGATGALLYAGKFLDPNNNLAALRGDGRQLAELDRARLTLLDPVTGSELYSLDGHQGAPLAFNFSADGRLVSGGPDGTLAQWSPPKEPIAEFVQHIELPAEQLRAEGSETQIALDHKGQQFLVGGADGTGVLFDAHSLSQRRTLLGHSGGITAAAFSPDDQRIATGGTDHSVRLWDTATGNQQTMFRKLTEAIWAMSFDPSGRFLSGEIGGYKTAIWETTTGAEVSTFDRDNLMSQAFNHDGSEFAVGSTGRVAVWNLATHQTNWTESLPADENGAKVGVVRYSPDGSRLLATLERHRAFILDARDGHVLQQLEEPSAAGLYVGAFSPDGTRVALGDIGKSVLVWRPADGKVMNLASHTAEVRAVTFSKDGSLLLTAGADGSAKVWDAETGELLNSYAAHDGAISWLGAQWSLDGNTVFTNGLDQAARIWSAMPEQRNARTLEATLHCNVAWRVEGTALIAAPLETVGCDLNR